MKISLNLNEFQIICPSSFLMIAYYMTGQPPEVMRFCQTWIICVLLAILAQSLGIATGAAFNTDVNYILISCIFYLTDIFCRNQPKALKGI